VCDYSILNTRTRDAAVDDKLVTHNFGYGTTGFCALDAPDCAVCLKPGTEIAFDGRIAMRSIFGSFGRKIPFNTAIFRQVDKGVQRTHHDALEFPDGSTVLLTMLTEGLHARVLQLPAAPRDEKEVEEQRRVVAVG
jgi:hypothetical protein